MSPADPVPFPQSRARARRALAVRAPDRAARRHRRPASRRSASRSASRSIRSRRSSGRCCSANLAEFGRYPPNKGIPPVLRSGSRAGSTAATTCRARSIRRAKSRSWPAPARGCSSPPSRRARFVKSRVGRPAILIPNPFYAVYSAGALAADCEPVYLAASAETGFLPDLDALTDDLLGRTVALYLASPSNPQGAVASAEYLARVVALARRFGFMVFADECYSEIYSTHRPAGMLQAAGADFANVVVFHSLSKRSSLPGLRVGFAAGDARFIAPYLDLRTVSAPQIPVPAQEVAIAAYDDESPCRGEPRALPGEVRPRRPDHRRPLRLPAPGRRLLPVARRLGAWRRRGRDGPALARGRRARAARQLRGAHRAPTAAIPATAIIRVAMVQDAALTAEALHRLVGHARLKGRASDVHDLAQLRALVLDPGRVARRHTSPCRARSAA